MDSISEISYSPRVQGKCSIVINVNGERVCGSPFAVLIKAREQAVGSGNLSARGKNHLGLSVFSPRALRYFSSGQERACSQALLVKPFVVRPKLLDAITNEEIGFLETHQRKGRQGFTTRF